MSTATQITRTEYDPQIQAGADAFLARLLPVLNPAAAVDTGKFAPGVAGVTAAQKAAQQMAATQAGLGQLDFDPQTGTVTGIGQGTGIAGFQPFLNQAAGLADAGAQAALLGQGAGRADIDAARGLVGPGQTAQFMSPFQQQVIDATKASFENKRLQQRQQIADQAVAAGAFGGGREGVQRGVFDAQTNIGLAQLEADLRAQGLQQAQQQQAQAIGQFGALSGLEQGQATQNLALLGQAGGVQSGLASLQPQLTAQNISALGAVGQQSQALNQAALDAQAAANREAAYETQQRLGFFGSQLAPLMGAYGAQTQFSTTQQTPPSTLQTILGTGLGLAGIARAFG
jgi:hypothetical protein